MSGKIESMEAAREYILAGDALTTFVSKKTGRHYTYRVYARTAQGPWFVSLLVGDEQYMFLGTIFPDGVYRYGNKSSINEASTPAQAFRWAWDRVRRGAFDPQIEIWHSGRCGRCGRTLTDPESIRIGLGPICAHMASA